MPLSGKEPRFYEPEKHSLVIKELKELKELEELEELKELEELEELKELKELKTIVSTSINTNCNVGFSGFDKSRGICLDEIESPERVTVLVIRLSRCWHLSRIMTNDVNTLPRVSISSRGSSCFFLYQTQVYASEPNYRQFLDLNELVYPWSMHRFWLCVAMLANNKTT